MFLKRVCNIVVGIALAVSLWGREAAAQGVLKEGNYPAPRYPNVDARSPEELLKIARAVAHKPANRDQLRPGYGIRKGERVLIVVDNNFERPVLDAIVAAIKEAGGKPDVMITDAPPKRQAEGWQQPWPTFPTSWN